MKARLETNYFETGSVFEQPIAIEVLNQVEESAGSAAAANSLLPGAIVTVTGKDGSTKTAIYMGYDSAQRHVLFTIDGKEYIAVYTETNGKGAFSLTQDGVTIKGDILLDGNTAGRIVVSESIWQAAQKAIENVQVGKPPAAQKTGIVTKVLSWLEKVF